jgi:hypothetical protein
MAPKISTPNSVRLLSLGWMKCEVHKRKADTRDDFLGNFDAAVHIKKREDQPRRTTRDLRTPVDGEIFEQFIVKCNKICHLNIKLKLN